MIGGLIGGRENTSGFHPSQYQGVTDEMWCPQRARHSDPARADLARNPLPELGLIRFKRPAASVSRWPASGFNWGANWGAGVARSKSKLSAVQIKAAGTGKLQDGAGLILDKEGSGGKWIWRYSIAGRRREMGLGAWPAVSLAAARQARDRWAAVLSHGRDPIAERSRLIEAERAEMDRHDPTLAEATATAFEARKAQLRGDGERGRWLSPLQIHVIPKLGKRRLSTLHQTDVRDVLAPIWKKKPATADKAHNRLRIVLQHAKLSGVDVDPTIVDAARQMLGELRQAPVPIEAVPWREIPALFARLQANPTASHMCLQWMILTAVRSDGCRGARMVEIDADVWTVPADRVKGQEGKVADFRVPLSPPALALADQCSAVASVSGGLLFPGRRSKPLSSTALQKAMNELAVTGRPHGFRTSFRTWVQDTDAASFDVAETALGHIIGGTVERSYARSDLLDRRRALMNRWGEFVTGQAAKVVPLRGQA